MERPNAEQIARFRQMTPGERWMAAQALYWSVRRLKEAHLRALHPEWSEPEILAEAKRQFSHVRG